MQPDAYRIYILPTLAHYAFTHLWICVLTDSGATRRPRVPFPKSTRTNHWILEVFKKKGGQKLKTRSVRQVDGVPCVTAAT